MTVRILLMVLPPGRDQPALPRGYLRFGIPQGCDVAGNYTEHDYRQVFPVESARYLAEFIADYGKRRLESGDRLTNNEFRELLAAFSLELPAELTPDFTYFYLEGVEALNLLIELFWVYADVGAELWVY